MSLQNPLSQPQWFRSNRIVSFRGKLLVPLVTKKLALNRVLSFTQCGKTFLLAILLVMLIKAQFVPALGLYIFVVAISILDGFASPVSYAMILDMPQIWERQMLPYQ